MDSQGYSGSTVGSSLPAKPPAGQSTRLRGLTQPTSSGGADRRIGEVIVELGFAEAGVVGTAVATARERGQPTGKVLLDTGVLTSDQLAHAVAERYGLDYLDLSIFEVDMRAATLWSPASARRYDAIPVAFLDENT